MDPRRSIPRTDALLADPRLEEAAASRGRARVKAAVVAAQDAARRGEIAVEGIVAEALRGCAALSSLTPVLNATGVVVHTNVGRAPLSDAAAEAARAAAGYVELEIDLASGERSRRARALTHRLTELVPPAQAALVVNNCAAALVLATTALATGGEVLVSRGEFVEIGAGFRLSDLVASTGVRVVEVGTTNRTTAADYARAVTERTGAILKIHPSNFRVEGFTSAAGVAELAPLGPPVVADLGSGLLAPDPHLPHEPDVASALSAGAALALCSGDKLLGGPQAGIVLGRADLVERLRTHPLARAVRVDKLTVAALEASLGAETPVTRYRRLTEDDVRARTQALADAVGGAVVPHEGRIGGGGAPGHVLPGLAVALPGRDPDGVARRLRTGTPAVLPVVSRGRCLVDLRCVEPRDDAALAAAIQAALP